MESTKKLTISIFLKKYIYIPFLGFLFGIAICYFLIYSEQQERAVYSLKNAVLASMVGTFIALVFSKSVIVLNRLLPYFNQTGNRLFTGFIVHFLISFSISFGFFYLYRVSFFDSNSFYDTYSAVLIKLGIILLVLTIIFEVIYFALYSYYSYSKFQIEVVKQERKQIELQLKALKSQLSPHFLFNCLNTISSLIYKDAVKAEIFIRRLAKMYDFSLKSYHQKLITIKEEIEFVKAYVFLVQTRFQDNFICNISVNNDLLMTKIPPLTLQMLAENAVKHNQLSTDNPIILNILSKNDEIIVENNITEPPKDVTSFHIGLKNINNRYSLLFDKEISVVKAEKFTVKIPIIR